ncbi:hypothetical protein CTI12_AA137770 [Artemisia annua]|uniref:Uncharacterized protein n=1 Tax=Artemisia annua TaxID=35608 RepID=A0A2U1PM79_ARTAN|nr:hypothetical protein CTI12_AA137770 [Artemisia annua]
MDKWGDHAVYCSSEVGVKFRHNLVRDILVDICSKVGIMVRKEAPMGFLSEDGKELRPADLLLFNWLQDEKCKKPFTTTFGISMSISISSTPGNYTTMTFNELLAEKDWDSKPYRSLFTML